MNVPTFWMLIFGAALYVALGVFVFHDGQSFGSYGMIVAALFVLVLAFKTRKHID